ncbi:hypothetical protein JCGZ_11835 [Jatropha curcas]|uniref:Uncharacterized protein n=1 Tax=Jatropha curcas TaxID=180498 RepID=A0A067LBZ7_JATCU|nr:hypothetical protein JCGZ_11835 [Jatropha curcas]
MHGALIYLFYKGKKNTAGDGNVAPNQNLGGIHIEEPSSHGLMRPPNPTHGSKKGNEKVDPTSTNKFNKKRKATFSLGLHYDEVTGVVQWNPGMWNDITLRSSNRIPIEKQRKVTTDPPMNIYDRNPKYGDFLAVGLQCNGSPYVTARQLFEQQ